MTTSSVPTQSTRARFSLPALLSSGLEIDTNASGARQRLRSLDAFRGLIMFLLVAEGSRVYDVLSDASSGTFLEGLMLQFHHHPWNGLRFWDLVQPFFMFIVGVAMAFSLHKRWSSGATWQDTFRHVLVRCAILFFLGVLLHCVSSGRLVWELWNVLTQLSFTILVAFLIFRLPFGTQLLISFALLAVTEALYRGFPAEGFNQPFVKGENFGSWFDMVLMGKINGGGWVAVNALPTAAHTIWGVLAGKVLMSSEGDAGKIKLLVLGGLCGLLVGYGLDLAGITPIIKRICTSSFVIVSGGWCLLALALFYWLIDVRGIHRWTKLFVIVGMNPIFIYMYSLTIGRQWTNDFVEIFMGGFLGTLNAAPAIVEIATAAAAFSISLYLCYWLYQRHIFIKI